MERERGERIYEKRAMGELDIDKIFSDVVARELLRVALWAEEVQKRIRAFIRRKRESK